MSNTKRCPKCGSGLIDQLLVYRSDGNTKYECRECGHAWLFPVERQTVFQQITQSPEVLAKKFLYIVAFRDSSPDGIGMCWKSTILPGEKWDTEPEALAASVAELKRGAE